MSGILLNRALSEFPKPIFAGDHEVTGPVPWLGHQAVSGLGCHLNLIHFHHRHEFKDGHNKGLWGTKGNAYASASVW